MTLIINFRKLNMLIISGLFIILILIFAFSSRPTMTSKTVFTETRNLRSLQTFLNKKVIMITFDDGPSENTSRLLDELAKKEVRVTFFMMGNKIELYPEIVKRAYKDGHSISNHSYSHKDLRSLKKKKLLEEINKTNELLASLGIENRYFRPPYGFSNKRVFKTSEMSFIYWNVDPKDWKYKDPEVICQRIIDKAEEGSIIVVHDTYKSSIEGILLAIDHLLEAGYALISLEEAEMMGFISPTPPKKYYELK